MYIRIIIACLLFSVFSCSRENIDIQGKVIDSHTKNTIPNMKIIVQDLVKNGNKEMAVYKGEFSTDSTGHFAYSLRKENNVYLYNFCVVGDSNYAFSTTKLGLADLYRNGKFLNFNSHKLTDLIIRTDLNSKYQKDDLLFVSWKSDKVNGVTLYPYKIKNYGFTSTNTGLKWSGGDVKSEIKTKVFAEKETIVKWEIYRSGERMVFTDTILCRRDVNNYITFKM